MLKKSEGGLFGNQPKDPPKQVGSETIFAGMASNPKPPAGLFGKPDQKDDIKPPSSAKKEKDAKDAPPVGFMGAPAKQSSLFGNPKKPALPEKDETKGSLFSSSKDDTKTPSLFAPKTPVPPPSGDKDLKVFTMKEEKPKPIGMLPPKPE